MSEPWNEAEARARLADFFADEITAPLPVLWKRLISKAPSDLKHAFAEIDRLRAAYEPPIVEWMKREVQR